MAARNVSPDNSISDFILDGSRFSYDRLAEDVLSLLYNAFKVEKRLIPPPRFAENSYRNSSATHRIARLSKIEQFVYRSTWYAVFTSKDATLWTQTDATKLYEFVAGYMHGFTRDFVVYHRKCTPALLFHISFAFMVELTLFLIMKKNRRIVKKMARAWVMYFRRNLKEAFEADGGLSRVLQETSENNIIDILTFEFIRDHCVPYTGEPVYQLFLDALNKETLEKSIGKRMKRRLEELGLQARHSDSSSLGNDESEFNPSQLLEVHERLGLVPHEDVLKKCVDLKRLPTEETPPEDTDDSTAKAIRALSLLAERRKAKKLVKERSLFSMTKTQLHHHKEDGNLGASCVETNEEPEARLYDRVPPIQREYQGDSADPQSLIKSDATGTNYSAQGAIPRT